MSRFNFILKTAWRDSRKNRGRLLLFISSIILGISALVAINSFNYNIRNDIDKQAATLLGADLIASARKEIPESTVERLKTLPGEMSYIRELLSMAFFPETEESSLVNIKAVDGEFPFYGKMKTEPIDQHRIYSGTKQALLAETLMQELGLNHGDSIRLGNATFTIGATLKTDFGNRVTANFAPTVYIDAIHLSETELIQPGSLVEHRYFSKTPLGFDVDSWKEDNREKFRMEGVQLETVADRKENLKEAFGGLNNFLNFVALVSLLLGCLGVASSVLIYVRSKVPSIAVFRCLGLKGREAFQIYLIQIVVLGLIGAIIGVFAGSAIQVMLPMLIQDFMPFELNFQISWRAVSEGLLIGFSITLLFALIPLLSIRNVSPLRTLRISVDDSGGKFDAWNILLYTAIILSLFGFLWILTDDVFAGIWFTIGLVISFGILYLVSRLIMWMVKRFFPRGWHFVLRQGLSNLYRPNNQTRTLLISIGLGTSVLTTLFITQGLILHNVQQMDAGNQPNMILFGIESDQKDGLEEITRDMDMPVIQHVPVVTMRLEAWNGRTKEEWLADTTSGVRNWAANREARVTYRDSLDRSETLTKGEFIGNLENQQDSIFISLDEGFAEALKVDLGDQMIFNVQGVRMETYVSSFRDIDFDNMSARFFIVFPTGVLEKAPQFHVLVTKSPNTETAANFKRTVIKKYSNISVVDLGMILESLGDLLKKVSYVIQFMAFFSILTGLLVLISSLFLSKVQRIRENVLLRTVGASGKQLLYITATEYSLLGILSAATGIIIAIFSSWALAVFQLELDFTVPWLKIVLVFIFVVLLVVVIGLLNSRDVLRRSPLEVLRREVG